LNDTDGNSPVIPHPTGDNSVRDDGPSADADGGAVSAAFYGNPLSLSFEKAAAVQSAANFLQRTSDGALFSNQTNGPNAGLSSQDKDDDEDPAVSELREAVERQKERDEWAHTESTLAGVTMTGEEWADLSEEVKSGPLRKWLTDRMKKDGMTDDEAERMADKVAELERIQSIPEALRTEQERKTYSDGKDSAQYQKYIQASEAGHRELAGEPSRIAFAAKSETRENSVDLGSELFASAPDLGAHHAAAVAAVEPLDQLKSVTPSIAPAPKVIGAGLEV